MRRKVLIVGGGPAGSSLAIRLARASFDVTLVERDHFPRQKLCGEFISPECIAHFVDLGVYDQITLRRGDRIRETAFYAMSGKSVVVPSAVFSGGDALALSRAAMDLVLLDAARLSGVVVVEGAAVSDLIKSDGRITGARFRQAGATRSIDADILVDATGRSGIISRLIEKSLPQQQRPSAVRSGCVAFKAHLSAAAIPAGRCEIYFFGGGYGGLTNVEDGAANLCFIAEADRVRRLGADAGEVFRNLVMANPRARETMMSATIKASWIAVAIGEYGRKQLCPRPGVFCVGDAAAFIDPFTGSGMLLALESSQILAEAIIANPDSPRLIAQSYSDDYARRFDSRLRTSAVLRRAAFRPGLAGAAIALAGTSVRVTRLLARLTRRPALALVAREQPKA